MNIAALANDKGLFDPVKIALSLRTTVSELADSCGLGLDAVHVSAR